MTDKYKPLLVVGGPHDGEWHIGEGLEILKIVQDEIELISRPISFGEIPKRTVRVSNYKLECLRVPGRFFKFYRYIDLPVEEAFEKLFQNYHPT